MTSARARLALYATALLAALAVGPRGPLYWDSFGYVTQALTGQVGGLALGRPLFVLASHAFARALLAAGLSVWTLEPALRALWLAVSALAAPATHALALRCRLGARGALLAALSVALSPAMAHASRAVLTDAPSVALTVIAFALAARAVQRAPHTRAALVAGAALGAAFGLREQAIVQSTVLALMLPVAPRGARVRVALAMALGFAITALAPLLYVFTTQREYLALVRGWFHAMHRERASHPYGPRDFAAYLGWLVALGPLPLVAALTAWTRRPRALASRGTVRLAVALPSLAQLVLLAGYQDIAFSPRYLLPALPGALAIPAGYALARCTARSRTRFVLALAALALPALVAAPWLHARERPLRNAIDTMPARLRTLPARTVVVTGQPCAAVDMVRRLARADSQWTDAQPAWQAVCPGWTWPADLAARLDAARGEGRTVVLDLRDGVWVGGGQNAARAQVERYAREHAGERGVQVWE